MRKNNTLLPVALFSAAAFLGLSGFLGAQMAQGKDPKVKAQKEPQHPVQTVIKKRVKVKKVIVWKKAKSPAVSYASSDTPAPSYSAPAQTYSAPAQTYSEPAPSPAPPAQGSAS